MQDNGSIIFFFISRTSPLVFSWKFTFNSVNQMTWSNFLQSRNTTRVHKKRISIFQSSAIITTTVLTAAIPPMPMHHSLTPSAPPPNALNPPPMPRDSIAKHRHKPTCNPKRHHPYTHSHHLPTKICETRGTRNPLSANTETRPFPPDQQYHSLALPPNPPVVSLSRPRSARPQNPPRASWMSPTWETTMMLPTSAPAGKASVPTRAAARARATRSPRSSGRWGGVSAWGCGCACGGRGCGWVWGAGVRCVRWCAG